MQDPNPVGVLPWLYILAAWMGKNANGPVGHHQRQGWFKQSGSKESSAKVQFIDEYWTHWAYKIGFTKYRCAPPSIFSSTGSSHLCLADPPPTPTAFAVKLKFQK